MRIIQNGDKEQAIQKMKDCERIKYYRSRCKLCGCKFEYDSTDILYDDIDLYTYRAYVLCPCCDNDIKHHWWNRTFK